MSDHPSWCVQPEGHAGGHPVIRRRRTVVYAVVRDDQDGHEYNEYLFASRELAERYLGAEHQKLREQYDRLAAKAGSPIPRVGYQVKNEDGSKRIVPQREEHPGSFEDWLRSQDKGWIEECEVLNALPSNA